MSSVPPTGRPESLVRTRPRTLQVRTEEDVVLSVTEWSERGIPCLLLHGLGASAAHWREFARDLRTHFRVLALDWRGHGNSGWDPTGRYTSRRFLQDLERTVEVLCPRRAILVGHSMGAALAMQFAARRPERMAGLVLVETGAELEPRGLARLRTDTRKLPSVYASPEAYATRLETIYPLVSPVLLRQVAHEELRPTERGDWEPKTDRAIAGLFDEFGSVAPVAARSHLEECARAIRCPTLVVRGKLSSIVSASAARKLHQAIPLARFAEVPRAGHAVILDRPAALLGVVLEFLLGNPEPIQGGREADSR